MASRPAFLPQCMWGKLTPFDPSEMQMDEARLRQLLKKVYHDWICLLPQIVGMNAQHEAIGISRYDVVFRGPLRPTERVADLTRSIAKNQSAKQRSECAFPCAFQAMIPMAVLQSHPLVRLPRANEEFSRLFHTSRSPLDEFGFVLVEILNQTLRN